MTKLLFRCLDTMLIRDEGSHSLPADPRCHPTQDIAPSIGNI
ncbi:hypothetical protein [Plantibacter elymi (nom. nud.)]|nr:hypothetical protein [Plantibacter sp. VKM Ac-1784]